MRLAKFIRYTARTVLVVVSLFWFVFALLSGAERYGGGLWGIIRNSPNALPWLVLFVIVYIAFRWEMMGGIFIIGVGAFTILHFDTLESLPAFLTISLPLVITGGGLMLSSYITQKVNTR